MNLSVQDHIRVRLQSRAGSVNGEDAESSDVEPSEARSLGGRESVLNLLKQALTLEQLEAAYNEARSRIFMDFEAKSRTGSVNGENAESSDVEPSEAGSLGGREGAPNRLKQTLTLEQREAAYNEARSRILMDFEARERRNDMSASSSTFSFISGSASVPMTLIHAQSSTSSSSRTTSTQHPLPPRPDWAIGLRPNPTLHPTRPSVHKRRPTQPHYGRTSIVTARRLSALWRGRTVRVGRRMGEHVTYIILLPHDLHPVPATPASGLGRRPQAKTNIPPNAVSST
jgi:hypothetical protein